MADDVKKDIKELKEFVSEQTGVILDAVDKRFEKMVNYFDGRFGELREEIMENRRLIKDLTLTLDEFMKRVINQDEEITLLGAKVDKISAFLKEKFGVEISAQ